MPKGLARVKPRLRAMVKEQNARKPDPIMLDTSSLIERNPNVNAELNVPYEGTLSNVPTRKPATAPLTRKTTTAHKHASAGKDIRKVRATAVALSDCVVKDADGNTKYVIPARRTRAASKATAKKVTVAAAPTEAVRLLGANITIEERMRLNGLL